MSLKKILLSISLALLIIVASLSGFILYLYHNPDKIKPMVERSLSSYTGSSCAMENLSYTLKPLTLKAENIVFAPRRQDDGFSIKLRLLQVDMNLAGSFGRKTLVLNNVQMKGLSGELISENLALPGVSARDKGNSSLIGKAAGSLVSLLLFRDILFQSGEMLDGQISAKMGGYSIQADHIRAQAGKDTPVILSCDLVVGNESQELVVTAPQVNIITRDALDITDLAIHGTVQSSGVIVQSPDLGVRTISVTSTFTYTHSQKTLDSANVQISGERISINPEIFGIASRPYTEALVDSFSLSAGFTSDLNKKEIQFSSMNIQMADLALKEKSGNVLSLQNVDINAQGSVNVSPYKVDLPAFNLTAKDLGTINGALLAGLGPVGAIKLGVNEAAVSLDKVLEFLPASTRQSLKPVTIAGSALLKGQIQGTREDEKWVWECDLESQLKDNSYAFAQNERQLKGRVSGVIHAKGRVPDVTISAEVKAKQNVLSSNELGLEPFEMKASLSVQYPRVNITGAAVQIPRAKITLGGKDIQLAEIDVQIPRGSADVKKGSVALPEIRFDSSALKNLVFKVTWEKDRKQIEVTGSETSLLNAASLYYPPPPDWKFSSRDAIQIEASAGEVGPWNVQAKIAFDALTFEASQGSILGENISLTANVQSTIDLERSKMDFTASLNAPEGEALYDRYYLNLKRNPLTSSGVGAFSLKDRLLELTELKFRLADLLPLELQGAFRQDQTGYNTDFKVTVPRAPLKPIFQQFVREPHKIKKPFLETIEPDGAISAELEIKGFLDNPRVTGRIGWHEGQLALTKQDILLNDIQLDLPVWYMARPGNISGDSLTGRLEMGSMKVPLLPEQPLDILLEVGPNRISINAPTTIKTAGGDIQLGAVTARDIFNSKREVRTSLAVDALQVQPIVAQFRDRPVTGTMSGNLDPVIYREHTLVSKGEIYASVFDGRIKVSNLGATGVLASTPVYKLNVEGNNLRLAQITEGTSFGRIEGVLSGYVHNFELAFGQPQKFDLLLETVKRNGISQRISVKAIDNIAQLGGGQSPFMGGLAGTFASFFKEFPYAKIGVRSTLENDMFTINGTIKEDGTEYIIKRSGISGVNVVNQNVDNRISFKDMVKRIKRISDTEGPIVK